LQDIYASFSTADDLAFRSARDGCRLLSGP